MREEGSLPIRSTGLYEASHFLAHTRVPLLGPLQHVRAHHMRHHVIDDSCW